MFDFSIIMSSLRAVEIWGERFMRLSSLLRAVRTTVVGGTFFCVGCPLVFAQSQVKADAATTSKACPSDDSGLKLPAGFCATVFADGIGHARHLVVTSDGVVYVNT